MQHDCSSVLVYIECKQCTTLFTAGLLQGVAYSNVAVSLVAGKEEG